MNKSETNAYNWLTMQGYKDINFHHTTTPDFTINNGDKFEVKTPKDGSLIFASNQIERLVEMPNAKILVFNESCTEPLAIIPCIELQDKPPYWGDYILYYSENYTKDIFDYIDHHIHEVNFHLTKNERNVLQQLYSIFKNGKLSYQIKIEEINPDKTTTLIREPKYKTLEEARKISDVLFHYFSNKMKIQIIDLDTNKIIYDPSEVK